jgi:phage tail sheath protein FI
MPFQLSPGIEIQERDLTTIIPAVATTAGGFVGAFVWGPVNQRVLIDSAKNLRSLFGDAPNDQAYISGGINGAAVDWLTAGAFLGYGNNLNVVRIVGSGSNSANSAGTTSAVAINNDSDFESKSDLGFGASYGNFVAKYPGALGNSLMVSICDNLGVGTSTGQVYRIVCDAADEGTFTDVPNPNPQTAIGSTWAGIGSDTVMPTANTGFKLLSKRQEGTSFVYYVESTGSAFASTLDGVTSGSLYLWFAEDVRFAINVDADGDFEVYKSNSATDVNFGTAFNVWEYRDNFEDNPGTSEYTTAVAGSNDEFHIVVIDQVGLWSGTPGTVLERFPFVSKAADAKKDDGTSNYWVDVLRTSSRYIWGTDATFPSSTGSEEFSGDAESNTFGSVGVRDFVLSGGANGSLPTAANYVTAYTDYFADPEEVDVQLLIGNGANSEVDAKTIADSLISIASARRDCLAFISPALNDVNLADKNTVLKNLLEFRNTLTSSSYAVLNSGWKRRFDAANDTERWIPLTGDIAGLCVRTDQLADSWFSPGGFNRGQIRNSIRLAYNPNKVARDRLYAAGINPVVAFQGEGTVLYGDRTLLSRPSAFRSIGVRRLFIVMEKAIATASKYFLFEFNDVATRAAFRNLVEPFLRNIQGRRGITDFRVICDNTNNTAEIIDSNNFVADIFVKPNRSINFIQLNFIATPTGISFEEASSGNAGINQ